jgi:hypothetical protein
MRLLLGQEDILKRRGSTWEHSTRADSARAAGSGSTRELKSCAGQVFSRLLHFLLRPADRTIFSCRAPYGQRISDERCQSRIVTPLIGVP